MHTEIRRFSNGIDGHLDGVEATVNCAYTTFSSIVGNEDSVDIADHEVLPCKVICSFSEGVIDFGLTTLGVQVSLRVDELMAILAAAVDASRELDERMTISGEND